MFRKSVGLAVLFCASSVWACSGPTNAAIAGALTKDLSKYKTVTFTVDDCVAVLSGQVDRLSDKLAVERKARKYGALNAVVNHIAVQTPVISDDTLVQHISQTLWGDRERNFNLPSFAVVAHDGQVTVSGLAYSPMQRDDALTLVASIRGVREIVDRIEISPLASLYPYLSDPHARLYGSDCAGTIQECGNAHW